MVAIVRLRETLVEPGGTVLEIRSDERVDDFVNQRPAAGGDVHHQRMMLSRVVSERGGRRGVE